MSLTKSDSVVYCIKGEEFKLEEIENLLENINDALLSTKTCQRPNASEVFVYDYSDAATKGKPLL